MRRLANLDIIRGFALCGILFANAPALLHLNIVRDDGVDPIARVLTFVVNERFFPLFSLLFGVGFALMWQTASARARSPPGGAAAAHPRARRARCGPSAAPTR